jgi:hypothetical protein
VIQHPGQWLFLVAVTLAVATAAHGAEVTSEITAEQLERVFVGEPTQLTLPPGFPAADAASLEGSAQGEVNTDRASGAGRSETSSVDAPPREVGPSLKADAARTPPAGASARAER